ncbi:helix-turn-helix domain containing protein [Nocardiopsis sp. N85]|uniref:TetR/AcrR family transcriptional regulator n=1 Tax=Nocardiopsis sp. N85 TaxID=3029400 RepID=UPI00237F01CD|nr:TetR/AcrR family transcriptional regulator [Nocardiopsis sp. N85]MDE3722184.1 helix-turn-helix domain containing protein [Nocardiopsis sp. N85]
MDTQTVDGRTARSRATRARIALAAARLFTARGYAATSVQAIADEAGVGVQTVYYTFRTKAAVLKEAVDRLVAGDDEPVPTLERPWVREALAAPDAAGQVRLQVAGTAEIMVRGAGLLEAVRGAAADEPDLAALWEVNVAQRRTVQRVFADALADRGALRPGTGPEEAADTMLGLLSPELFTLYTVHVGRPVRWWRDWATDAVLSQVVGVSS